MKLNKKILHKSIFFILIIGMIVTMSGCFDKEGNKQQKKNTNDKKQQETPKEKDQFAYVTKEVMTTKETNALDENQFIKAEDLKKIPDAKTLEDRDLAFIYCYDYTAVPVGEEAEKKESVGYDKPVPENYMHIIQKDPEQGAWKIDHIFTGIKILPVATYFKHEDGTWIKFVNYNAYSVDAGPILSKEKQKEVEEKRKASGYN